MRRHWPARGTTHGQAGLRLGFRSGLEEKNAKHLEGLNVPVMFEVFKLKYAIPQSLHTYTPDFRLPNGIIVETKGRWMPVDRAKHLFVKAQYPGLDIRIVFSSSKAPITTGSKTTLGMWATSHGFKWADKLIPVEWVLEDGPVLTPEEAIAGGPSGFEGILAVKRPQRIKAP